MIALHQTVFNTMRKDRELLDLLGLAGVNPNQLEPEISKRLVPIAPASASEHTVIHFWFPQSYLSGRSKLMEVRPIQFRIWSRDISLVTQQKIASRLKAIFIGAKVPIDTCQYSDFFYLGETQIPGPIFQMHGWSLEIFVLTRVENYSTGG